MRKPLSYLLPIKLKSITSKYNGKLEVTLLNGKKVLDTERSNYSYGSLQKILHKGLEAIKFNSETKNILVLGMGGGSIVPTIRKNFKSDAEITLVEIDPQIISIAKNEFDIFQFKNLKIIEADAFQFVKNQKKTFDLVIVDLFIIDTVPEVFTKQKFLSNLSSVINPEGKLIFNTMRGTMGKDQFQRILHFLAKNGIKTMVKENVEGSNNLILGKKIL